jgi:aspartyl/asparaginyl beta-hydroxylase (cupin superfamily)
MRLSVLPASTIITMHTDASCHAQLAITTNEDCFVAARTGETRHVPVDGKLYIISTTLPHTAFNASEQERIHLSISIYDEDYIKMLKGESFSVK